MPIGVLICVARLPGVADYDPLKIAVSGFPNDYVRESSGAADSFAQITVHSNGSHGRSFATHSISKYRPHTTGAYQGESFLPCESLASSSHILGNERS